MCVCVSVCVCDCVCGGVSVSVCKHGFVVACEQVKVWNAEGVKGKEWERACSLPQDRWMWFSCLCVFFDAILTAIGHRGNNKDFWTRELAQEMMAFITHLGQLTAHWCHCDSPEEQSGFLMSVPVNKSHWHQAGLHDKDNYSALPHSWFMCGTGL